MKTGAASLLLLVVAVCGASAAELTVSTPGSPPAQTPTPPATRPPRGLPLPPELSVPYAETDALRGPAIRTPACHEVSGSFTFRVLADGRVEMRRTFDGPAPRPERPPRETAWGTWDGTELVLRGENDGGGFHKHENAPVNYVLRWDATVSHLAGTRNGAPIRLAPLELHERDCRGVKPPPVRSTPTPPRIATPTPTPDPGADPSDCPETECKGPSMGMPNWLCTDGRRGGPACKRLPGGTCGWVVVDCPRVQLPSK
jgi:hypothetical protein